MRVRRSKYKNKKTGKYDSQKEARRAAELRVMQGDGDITDLEEQVTFVLVPSQPGERAVKYIADFVYTRRNGERIVEDVKSAYTRKLPVYIIKRKLMLWVHGIRIIEV